MTRFEASRHYSISYHHVIDYTTDDPPFRAEDMMVLRPNCYYEATVRAMAEEEHRYYKAQTFNIVNGYAEGKLRINQEALVVALGSNEFTGDPFP